MASLLFRQLTGGPVPEWECRAAPFVFRFGPEETAPARPVPSAVIRWPCAFFSCRRACPLHVTQFRVIGSSWVTGTNPNSTSADDPTEDRRSSGLAARLSFLSRAAAQCDRASAIGCREAGLERPTDLETARFGYSHDHWLAARHPCRFSKNRCEASKPRRTFLGEVPRTL